MERKSEHTIRTLLVELKEKFPSFEKNQIFETLKSIYPSDKISKTKRNITIDNRTFTKPLAVNRKDKTVMQKEDKSLAAFFKNVTRGDFLKVIETDGESAKCINLSLDENIKKKYYDDDESHVNITFEDLANGTVKPFRRKVDKYLKEQNN